MNHPDLSLRFKKFSLPSANPELNLNPTEDTTLGFYENLKKWFDYVDLPPHPKTLQETLQELKQRNKDLEARLITVEAELQVFRNRTFIY